MHFFYFIERWFVLTIHCSGRFTRLQVTGLEVAGGVLTGVTTASHGTFTAPITVSCLNIWSQPTLGAWLGEEVRGIYAYLLLKIPNPTPPRGRLTWDAEIALVFQVLFP